MEVTILTPTYNRIKTLSKLYESLCYQSSKKFEWLIIDDGSEDDTEQLIMSYIKEGKIKIRYYKIKNGGKHRALNYGIKKIKNELVFFVDSDDWLTNDAIETVLFYGQKYLHDSDIAVLCFLRSFPDGTINGPKFEAFESKGNYIENRLNPHKLGDKAEVCFLSKLKEFPFIEIEDEKFLDEGYLWVNMALKYDTIFINKAIYIGNYLEEGLTRNIYKIREKNPKGYIILQKCNFNNKSNYIVKLKSIIKFIAYSIINGDRLSYQLNEIKKYRTLYIFCLPIGYLYFLYVKFKAKN